MQGKSSHSRPKLSLLQWMPRADLHVCVALLCQLLNGELSYAAIMKAAARVGLRQWFLTVMSDAGHIHYCQGSNSHIPPSRNVDWLTWEIYMRTRADRSHSHMAIFGFANDAIQFMQPSGTNETMQHSAAVTAIDYSHRSN